MPAKTRHSRAATNSLEYHRLFGGQILGQLVRAACVSCPDKIIKPLHAVFAREGRADEPVRYQVTRHHQGRSFATLTITARQSRGVLATSSICMHIAEKGPELQNTEPVPPVLGEEHRVELDLIPWETRSTDDLNATAAGPPTFQVWMRTPAVDGELAPALAAYATDLTLIGTALRPLDGFNQRGNGTVFTSAKTAHSSPPTRKRPCCASPSESRRQAHGHLRESDSHFTRA